MSALDNLLDEVRLEAEQAVRTEYENTVIELRAKVTELENERHSLQVSHDNWHALSQRLEDRLLRTRDALDKLSATL